MTDVSALTVEERLAILEANAPSSSLAALAAPLALVPPITIGELTDVPAPGSQIAAQWAQEVSSRVVQRFASKASLVGWAAPNGAYAVDVSTGILWRRIGNAWSQFTPWGASATGIATPGPHADNTGPVTLASVVIPADPQVRYATLSCHLRVDLTDVYPCTVEVLQGAGVLLQAVASPPAGQKYVAMTGTFAIPANAAAGIALRVSTTGPFWQPDIVTYAAAHLNRLDVTVLPR